MGPSAVLWQSFLFQPELRATQYCPQIKEIPHPCTPMQVSLYEAALQLYSSHWKQVPHLLETSSLLRGCAWRRHSVIHFRIHAFLTTFYSSAVLCHLVSERFLIFTRKVLEFAPFLAGDKAFCLQKAQ